MRLSSKNNLWLWFHRYTVMDSNSLPKNLCPLFWGGIFGIIFFLASPFLNIVTAYFAVKNKRDFLTEHADWDFDTGGFGGVCITFAILFLEFAGVFILTSEDISTASWWMWAFGWLLLPLCLGIIIGTIYLIYRIFKNKDDENTILVEGINAVYKSVCPLVSWEKGEDETNS